MRLMLTLLAAALGYAQQPPQPPATPKTQQRDLKVEKLDDTAPTAPTAPKIPTSYAVIIGVSKYPKLPAELQLQFTERDAQAIFTALISPEGGNFRVENVHMLTGDKATLAALRREIGTWLPSVAKDEDRVLIYFAGHGFMFQGKGYLAPSDFDRAHVAETGFPMDELGSAIGGKIHDRSKILLTDACRSSHPSPE